MRVENQLSAPRFSAFVDLVVPFHDVDMMGIVWHGRYVKYLEIARCRLLDQLDYNYLQMRYSGYSWPVIEMHIRYPAPARFTQSIRVTASLAEWENRLKINYMISDVESGERLTKGHTIQVAVDLSDNRMCFVSPNILREKLGLQ